MTRALPPDRSHVATEQRNPRSEEFDLRTTLEQVQLIGEDHAVVHQSVLAAAPAIASLVDMLVERVRAGGRLFYCGAGTSGRLGVLDASECPPTFCSDPGLVVGIIAGGDAALRRSSERREDDPQGICADLDAHGFASSDTLVAIAAGGTTPYALGALEAARSRGGATAFITCSPPAVHPACDHLILLETGPEILTGSTRMKAGSATKLALNCITTVLFTRLGKVHGNLMVDLAATNDKLVDRAVRTLRTVDPALSRERASALLHEARGQLKLAVLMHLRGLDHAAASALLAGAGGVLRAALGRSAPDAHTDS